ncbi:MAG TPA: TonB family protein [Drouetiella sp.]
MVDCAPVAEKENQFPGTTSGAALRAQFYRQEQFKPGKPFLASAALLALSLGWVGVLSSSKHAHDTLPWITSFCISAAATGIWFYLRLKPAPLSIFKIGEKRWGSLSGTLAATLAMFSAAIGGWILTHGMPVPEHIELRRQVIDIELVSAKDYQDNHDILPSTEPSQAKPKEAEVQARQSAVVPPVAPVQKNETAPADANSKPQVAAAKQTVPPPPQTVKTPPTRSTTPSTRSKQATLNPQAPQTEPMQEPAMIVRQPTPPPSQPASPGLKEMRIVPRKPERSQPVLEEVAGAQMFEVTEAQEKAGEIAQNGGHSAGGNGAQTTLNSYLREVHRRIKKAWIPGTDDTTSSAQIMFRLRKNGRLVSMKLLHSSGSPETDESAMHAVTASAPFKPLPQDFPAESLDLLYTFNYKIDTLSEIPPPQLE